MLSPRDLVTPQAIRELRHELGLSQAEFALRVGTPSQETVSRWENGASIRIGVTKLLLGMLIASHRGIPLQQLDTAELAPLLQLCRTTADTLSKLKGKQ